MATTTAYIAFGSNVGDSAELVKSALKELRNLDGITVSAVSEFVKTQPLSKIDQPEFLNAVAKIETSFGAEELLKYTQQIERLLGRERHQKWGPRTIDIDILLYGDEIIDTPKLTVPHKQMHLRSFVLTPMCEIGAEVVHPVLRHPMSVLAKRLGGSDFYIDKNKPQLISIAGIIGVGKTTLGQGLSKALGCELICEAYEDNPYMDEAYAGKQDIALDWQLYFLISRLKQISKDHLESGGLYISDYVFAKEQIYAKKVLTSEQQKVYQENYAKVEPKIADPVLAIYLMDTPAACLERIKKRNRAYEQQIEVEQLEGYFDDYEKLFAEWNKCPAITLDVDKFNCLDEKNVRLLADEVRSYVWTS